MIKLRNTLVGLFEGSLPLPDTRNRYLLKGVSFIKMTGIPSSQAVQLRADMLETHAEVSH
jgi:hypothetical protein